MSLIDSVITCQSWNSSYGSGIQYAGRGTNVIIEASLFENATMENGNIAAGIIPQGTGHTFSVHVRSLLHLPSMTGNKHWLVVTWSFGQIGKRTLVQRKQIATLLLFCIFFFFCKRHNRESGVEQKYSREINGKPGISACDINSDGYVI